MTQYRVIKTLGFILLMGIGISGCSTKYERYSKTTSVPLTTSRAKPTKGLSAIDLSQIGHIAPKGRVQDKEYNELEVVDQLIANGKDSIPYLISKLDDETVIHEPVMDFWSKITVGDVALIVLSDFSIDSTWTNETIPGASWDKFLERSSANRDVPAQELLDIQVARHGRGGLKAKWQKIWSDYEDRVVWDDKERCFRLS